MELCSVGRHWVHDSRLINLKESFRLEKINVNLPEAVGGDMDQSGENSSWLFTYGGSKIHNQGIESSFSSFPCRVIHLGLASTLFWSKELC